MRMHGVAVAKWVFAVAGLVMASTSVGCAVDATSSDAAEDEALRSLSGRYWIDPIAFKSDDDMVFAVDFSDAKNVRSLTTPTGGGNVDPIYGCAKVSWKLTGQGANRALQLKCPDVSAFTSYPVDSVTADTIVLHTSHTHRTYTLRTTRKIKGAPHYRCSNAKFDATIDMVGTRAFLTTKARQPYQYNVPKDESLFLETIDGKIRSIDDDWYEMKLPAKPGTKFSVNLKYSDQFLYYPHWSEYELDCAAE